MKKIVGLTLLLLLAFLGWKFFFTSDKDTRESFPETPKTVTLVINGSELSYPKSQAKTVTDFLRTQGFSPSEKDSVFPPLLSSLDPGVKILFRPARTLVIEVDGQKKNVETTADTVTRILEEENISLDEDDIVKPEREVTVSAGSEIVVTRVEIREEYKDTAIPFTTQNKEDDKLSWRKKVVEQKGVNGVKRTTYRVSYHNGKEVNRRLLSTETVEEPVSQIVTQGTYVKTGKSHTGGASWYAYTGTLSAANPWLPIGSYVRVTNIANGKSVIVKINDRGPFGKGRIIDLDKVAFEKIASLGTGVVNVKMEEIVN